MYYNVTGNGKRESLRNIRQGQSAAKHRTGERSTTIPVVGVGVSNSEVESTLPGNAEGGDMVCSYRRLQAGVRAHRDSVTNYLDIKGDTCSATAVWTEESKAEIKKTLNSKNYYVGVNGKMSFGSGNDITDLVLNSMTS